MSLERRKKKDRRNAHLKAAIYGLFLGRRKSPRRTSDKINGYIIVDYIEPKLVVFVIIPFIFSILDALFTLWLLTKGGIELNPIMEVLIDINPVLFFISKFLLTSLGILMMLLFRYFKIFGCIHVRHLLYGILGLYVWLIMYELYLIL